MSKALELIDRALELSPGNPEYLAESARCLALLHRDADALARVDQVSVAIDNARVLDTLGVVCARAGDHVRAAAWFQSALEHDASNAGIAFNLGASLRFVGRFDESAAAFERAIDLDPRCYGAHAALASLRRQTEDDNHIHRLETALAGVGDDVDGELQLRHALAKELEDLGRDDEAFEHLERGKARKRNAIDYDFARDRDIFASVIENFPATGRMDGAATGVGSPTDGTARQVEIDPAGRTIGDPSREPIFVVGMPRSGTTLVERILSSHPDVSTAGELQNFGVTLKRLAGTPSPRVLDPATVRAGLRVDPAELGRRYIESTRPLTGASGHFVDKMPLNFFYLGFIRRALPNARIVCLRRGAIDTCLSNFRQLFSVRFSYYDYAYDLRTTAEYFVEFDRLIGHWRSLIGEALLELDYEALVASPEPVIRRLLEHCGLAFDSRCLAFDRNATPVATASAVQVREPLNSASIGRWRRYSNRLAPAIEVLTAAGIPLESAAVTPSGDPAAANSAAANSGDAAAANPGGATAANAAGDPAAGQPTGDPAAAHATVDDIDGPD